MRILVVEDDKKIASFVSKGLKEAGFAVDVAEDGVDALGIQNIAQFKLRRGGIKVCKAEKQLIVGFYFTQKNSDFYRQDIKENHRMPLGLEIDVIDYNNVFSQNHKSWSMSFRSI